MIIASAIKYDNKIFLGRGHSAIVLQIKLRYKDCKLKIPPLSQGFYTDKHKYLTRYEAMEHAIECKQIKKEDIYSVFTSEDLWDQLDPVFKIITKKEKVC